MSLHEWSTEVKKNNVWCWWRKKAIEIYRSKDFWMDCAALEFAGAKSQSMMCFGYFSEAEKNIVNLKVWKLHRASLNVDPFLSFHLPITILSNKWSAMNMTGELWTLQCVLKAFLWFSLFQFSLIHVEIWNGWLCQLCNGFSVDEDFANMW